MSAKLYMFRGSEADNDHPLVPHEAFVADTQPEPLSDDEREQLEDCPFEHFAQSFAEQDQQADALSRKWAERCIYLIGAGVLIAYALGAFK